MNAHTKDIAESGVAAEELKQFVERLERLSEEKQALSEDIRDVFAEAKGRGFSTKALREISKLRKQDRDERMEERAVLELYADAIGLKL